jgi:hypothetical protein
MFTLSKEGKVNSFLRHNVPLNKQNISYLPESLDQDNSLVHQNMKGFGQGNSARQ